MKKILFLLLFGGILPFAAIAQKKKSRLREKSHFQGVFEIGGLRSLNGIDKTGNNAYYDQISLPSTTGLTMSIGGHLRNKMLVLGVIAGYVNSTEILELHNRSNGSLIFSDKYNYSSSFIGMQMGISASLTPKDRLELTLGPRFQVPFTKRRSGIALVHEPYYDQEIGQNINRLVATVEYERRASYWLFLPVWVFNQTFETKRLFGEKHPLRIGLVERFNAPFITNNAVSNARIRFFEGEGIRSQAGIARYIDRGVEIGLTVGIGI